MSIHIYSLTRYGIVTHNLTYTVYPKKYAHGFCFVVVMHWLIFPYPSGLLHWHCSNLTIAPVPAKQTWWIWINASCEFIMNDCITTTKQSTTKPCAYFLGYTVSRSTEAELMAWCITIPSYFLNQWWLRTNKVRDIHLRGLLPVVHFTNMV